MMYNFTNKIFIVWGGNYSLALNVAERLTRKTKGPIIEAVVGGAAEYIGDDCFIGPRVISQMNNCSKAIILAEPYFDKTNNIYRYRENLMFEWGYLMNRLPQGAIAVYVIGADRTSLPSDLQGAFTAVVPVDLKNDKTRSTWITSEYKKSLNRKDDFVVFDMMLNWQKWKSFINRQIDGRDAPQPDLFRRVLMNAFMPCSYCNDIQYYANVLSSVQYTQHEDNKYLLLARSILNFTILVRSKNSFAFGEFAGIKRGFSKFAGYEDPFFSAVARHFMGLCLKMEAKALNEIDKQKEQDYYRHALSHFEVVLQYFQRVDDINDLTKKIWLGFVYSNIAQCKEAMGFRAEACMYFSHCDEYQNAICDVLATGSSQDIYHSYLAERYIQVMRYNHCAGLEDEDAFIEIRLKYAEVKDKMIGYAWNRIVKDVDRYFTEKYTVL